jgi:hypothetical protein
VVKRAARIVLGGPLKAGARFAAWSGKKAGRGSVWVVKKVAVDPASRKVQDWGLVKNGRALKEALKKDGLCPNCGKGFRDANKHDVCSAKCAQAMAEQFSKVKQEKVELAVDQSNELYLNCGCNRKNLFHATGCSAGLVGHRVADNIKWSEKNPEYMEPNRRKAPGEGAGTRGRYSRSQVERMNEAVDKKGWFR